MEACLHQPWEPDHVPASPLREKDKPWEPYKLNTEGACTTDAIRTDVLVRHVKTSVNLFGSQGFDSQYIIAMAMDDQRMAAGSWPA